MILSTPKKTQNIEGRHIASLTHSQAVILNLQQLQKMAAFCYEVVFIDDPDLRIYAYQHSQAENSYIFIIPLSFYQSTKNKSRSFIELVCLYSQSITVPTYNPILQQFEDLLKKYCLSFHKKKGNNVIKLYIEDYCWCSYLDFVTSQAIQFKAKNSKELLAMKKLNAFEYCINAFKQQLMPEIYQNSVDSIENALQFCINEIKQLYHFLACFQRFGVIYDVMKQEGASFNELINQIEALATSKNVTTVGDEECQEMINEELTIIVCQELNSQQKQLMRMKPMEQQVFLVKIISNLLQKLRAYNFDINDQKYLFLSSKIIEKVYQLHDSKLKRYLSQRMEVDKIVEEKDKEIEKLKKQLRQLKNNQYQSAKKESTLTIIKQEGQEEIPTVKRVQTQIQNHKSKHITLKDLKQPLQVINTNVSSDKLHKIPLSKAKQKLKEGFKKKDDQKTIHSKHGLKS